MKVSVATIDRGDARPIPQTPWPLVQPPPTRVPAPVRRPPMMITGMVASNTKVSTPSPVPIRYRPVPTIKPPRNQKPPRGFALFRRQQPGDDAADPRHPAAKHQQKGGGQADQAAAYKRRNWCEIFHDCTKYSVINKIVSEFTVEVQPARRKTRLCEIPPTGRSAI